MEVDCPARRNTHNYETCSCQKGLLWTWLSAELRGVSRSRYAELCCLQSGVWSLAPGLGNEFRDYGNQGGWRGHLARQQLKTSLSTPWITEGDRQLCVCVCVVAFTK